MKKKLSLLLLVIFTFSSLSACSSNTKTTSTTSTSISSTSVVASVDVSSPSDSTKEKSSSTVERKESDDYNEKTNSIIQVCGIQFSIPDSWGEGTLMESNDVGSYQYEIESGQKYTSFHISYTDNAEFETIEKYLNYHDDIIIGMWNGIDNFKFEKPEKITFAGDESISTRFSGSISGVKVDGISLFNTNHNNNNTALFISLLQVRQSDEDHTNDFLKVIENTTDLALNPAPLDSLKTVIDMGDSTTDQTTSTPANTSAQASKALSQAQRYLKSSNFSYSGLIEQLEYEGYSNEDATYAADNCGADWKEQAAGKAKRYLKTSNFSYPGLIEQLEYEGFSNEEATYAVDNCGANWTEQALGKAKKYLHSSNFSYSGLIEQLEYEGYSTEDATAAADNCGADWKEQAAGKAKRYMTSSDFTYNRLIEQLKYEGFTDEEAKYGADNCGATW